MRHERICALLALTVAVWMGHAGAATGETWYQIYGGKPEDYAASVRQTRDGGFIMTGRTRSFGAGQYDAFLLKVDRNGRREWDKTFGGPEDDVGHSVQQTSDGGYILTGYTRSLSSLYWDLYLLKTDAHGNRLWSKNYGGRFNDSGESVQQTRDGGFIVAGVTDTTDPLFWDVYLLKTDGEGNYRWHKTFGSPSADDQAFSVQQTGDGGFILAGSTTSFSHGFPDAYLIRTDGDGNELWSKPFGGTQPDSFGSVQQTSDGGFIATGSTSTDEWYSEAFDLYLVKTDGDGNELWSRTFDGAGEGDGGASVQQTADGGYFVVGTTTESLYTDVWLIQTDGNGNELESRVFGGPSFDGAVSGQRTVEGGVIVAGTTTSFGPGDLLHQNAFLAYGRKE